MEQDKYFAGFWLRFMASMVDGILFSVIGILFYFMLWKNVELEGFNFLSLYSIILASIQGFILYVLIHFFYDVLMNVNLGGTLGKLAVGLEVRQEEDSDERITYGKAVGRYFSKNYISAPIFMLGYIWAGFDPHKQAWHDRLAKTYVVKTKEYGAGGRIMDTPEPPIYQQPEPQRPSGKKIGAVVITGGTGKGRTLDVRAPHTTIGSDSQCDIVLDNDYHYVSRKHCEIFTDKDGGIFLRHLSNTNPTIVNGQKITVFRLRDNDKITICDFSLQFKKF